VIHGPRDILVGCAAALLAAGCAGPPSSTERRPLGVDAADPGARSLVSADSGLELRKWLVADDPALFASSIGAYAEGEEIDPTRHAALRRNGFRLVRVPLADVEALLDRLHGATMNVNAWHGQILDWRALHELPLGRRPITVAVDGHVRSFQGGRFALSARAWTVQLEDGPRLQLELVPEYRPESRPGDFRQLLGQSAPQRRRFESMAIEAELEEGYAYLLTSAPPREAWGSDETESADAPSAAPAPAASSRAVGPGAFTPPTLGRMMLSTESGTGQRAVLLFVPRIPAAMHAPQPTISADAGGATP
jgi:hypothetical protein